MPYPVPLLCPVCLVVNYLQLICDLLFRQICFCAGPVAPDLRPICQLVGSVLAVGYVHFL